jgi:hypothetical protein
MKGKQTNWNDVSVLINGKTIGPGQIEMVEFKGPEFTYSALTVERDTIEALMTAVPVQPHHTDMPGVYSRRDMLTILKRIGMRVRFYKTGKRYTFTGAAYSTDKPALEALLGPLTEKEWRKIK